MKKKKNGLGENIKGLYLVSTVGLQLVISVFLGLGFGIFIDSVLNTKPVFLMIFLVAGIGSGFLNLYRVVKRDIAQEDNEQE